MEASKFNHQPLEEEEEEEAEEEEEEEEGKRKGGGRGGGEGRMKEKRNFTVTPCLLFWGMKMNETSIRYKNPEVFCKPKNK